MDLTFDVMYTDWQDTSIYNLSEKQQLPTSYKSNYPDTLRVDLSGHKTGPGLTYTPQDTELILKQNTFEEKILILDGVPEDFNLKFL